VKQHREHPLPLQQEIARGRVGSLFDSPLWYPFRSSPHFEQLLSGPNALRSIVTRPMRISRFRTDLPQAGHRIARDP
jgi:hypothetical protein